MLGDGKHTGVICTPRARKKKQKTTSQILRHGMDKLADLSFKVSRELEPALKTEAEAFLARYPLTSHISIANGTAVAHLMPGTLDSDGDPIRKVFKDPFLVFLEDLQYNQMGLEIPHKITFNGASAILHYT